MKEAAAKKAIEPLDLVMQSSGVVLVVLLILVAASFAVWVIWILKALQLRRLDTAHTGFEDAARGMGSMAELLALARQYPVSPGARVIRELSKRRAMPHLSAELLMSVAKRAIVSEQQRASSLMPLLSSIASASPFIGLFGTVWGIMDAFLQIGVHKSASLPVVAPAIGEALVATAFGLVAAIPATIGFNFVDQRITDLISKLEASSEAWVEALAADPSLAQERPSRHG